MLSTRARTAISPEAELDTAVRTLGLRETTEGTVLLRTSRFDIDRVRDLVATSTVAALDAATSTDPRMRGAGRRTLHELLGKYW